MTRSIKISLITLFLSLHTLAFGDNTLLSQSNVQHFIRYMIEKHHFTKKEMTETMKNATIQQPIIDSMNKPYEGKPWDVYQQLFLTSARLQEGIQFWNENQEALQKAEATYGVPAEFIVAILGVETRYGKFQGQYRVLDALSTLAFRYPKRAPFFTKELEEFLILCREHHVSPTQYVGSYAGAMGLPQFMPSSYRYYAANFTGQSKKDLMNDNNDAIASVANYFHKHGWKYKDSIAEPAVLLKKPDDINTGAKTATYSLKTLQRNGVKPLHHDTKENEKAGLIALSTQKGPEYWIAYPNFYVITRYNSSPQYALVVYLLASQLHRTQALHKQHHSTLQTRQA